jgi:hypothetical protein
MSLSDADNPVALPLLAGAGAVIGQRSATDG